MKTDTRYLYLIGEPGSEAYLEGMKTSRKGYNSSHRRRESEAYLEGMKTDALRFKVAGA